MKGYKKTTKKQPKIKKPNQKKSKNFEKSQKFEHPRKMARYIGIIKTTAAGIKPATPQHNKTPPNTKRPKE